MKKMNLAVMVMGAMSALMFSTTAYAATSDLTGMEIDDSIADQRPVAVMVDNEKAALPHYGLGEADVVYEMMNSTENGRITRLMCLYKDWAGLDQTGCIRSARTTNVVIADEYNAVLIHDGGPVYIKKYLAKPYATNISGDFTRVKNGKSREFTEFVFGDELVKRFEKAGISTTYSLALERDKHFLFNEADTVPASDTEALTVDLGKVFIHNESKLVYNEATGSYDYNEYGKLHQDEEDAQPLSFKNVILQNVPFKKLDKNGYLNYEVNGSDKGYYISNGKVLPITWTKSDDTAFTHYYGPDGNEISINKCKTYIGLVPSDSWEKIELN